MLQRHASATLDRFESQLDGSHYARLPISAMPFQHDPFGRLPTDYTSHLLRPVQDAAILSRFELHPKFGQCP
jgi:hypothetical protein